MHLALDSSLRLPSGAYIPQLGYGVYQARGEECVQGVASALRSGYRHIDTAQGYRNEHLVARGLVEAGISRPDIYLTTKYMPTHKVYPIEAVYDYVRKSRDKLGYVDLMLLHAPWGGDLGRAINWEALGRAKEEGWVRDIGVSNFGVKHLEALPPPTPAVNQIELHPWNQQRDIVAYCKSHNITIVAYSPLARADPDRLNDPTLLSICEKHIKGAAQVLIRWSLQMGFVPLPKSVNHGRIRENAEVYDFELDEEDMGTLEGLDRGKKGAVTWNPVDAD